MINAGNGSPRAPDPGTPGRLHDSRGVGYCQRLNITFVGDLKYGRTVHSLCELLSHYDVSVTLVSPQSSACPAEFATL